MRALSLLALGLFGINTHAADISNFVSGAVCHDADGSESICEQSDDIYVTGESLCDWSGEQRRCTWFGFEFNYDDADPEVPLVCDYERSAPSAEGNYQGIRKHNATTGTFSYELSETTGHYYNPMYQLHSVPPNGQAIVVETYLDCSIGSVRVFDMTFRLHFSP